MNQNRIHIVSTILLAALAVLLTWLVFRGQDLAAIWARIREAKVGWVVLALGLTLLGHWSRARRWTLLLRAAGHESSTGKAFLSLMTGYFVNLGLPRLGELSRVGTLHRLEGAPFMKGIGTVVAERAMDLACLALLALGAYLTATEELDRFMAEKIIAPVAEVVGGKGRLVLIGLSFMAALTLAGAYLLIFQRERLRRWRLYERVEAYLRDMWLGIVGIFRMEERAEFLGHTVFIWLVYYSAPLFSLLALGMTGPRLWELAFAAFAVGSLARTLPLPGGSMGSYHWLLMHLLMIYGYSQTDGLALATLNHAVQTAFYVIVGGLSMVLTVVLLRQTKNGPD